MLIYDVESYPNIFTLRAEDFYSDQKWCFEISDRRSDALSLYQFLMYISENNIPMVGFNNEGYDYKLVHQFLTSCGTCGHAELYKKTVSIIESSDRFGDMIWPSDRFIKQIDLFKIHHFDNIAKSTSLKVLEFNMRSHNIKDLPFPPGTFLTHDQKDVLIAYNDHDVQETKKFARFTMGAIKFREYLSEKYGRDFTNHNDTKLGKDYFISELERIKPGCCYDKSSGKREMRQTHRRQIKLSDVIFPYIQFQHPEFQRIRNYLTSQTITQTKGALNDVSCTINDFTFVFGTGGIHGSLDGEVVETDDTHKIIDLDVTSYYPSIAIVNRVYPEHLGETFCDIYADVLRQRLSYSKKDPESKMLKLALNGVYGDSNNVYSPFYDPLYTMKITINGQLLLCMLSEHLMTIPGLSMVQINTDGMTVKCPRLYEGVLDALVKQWEDCTMLEMEKNTYGRMLIRDVNNYIATDENGDVKKRKGAYGYTTPLDNENDYEVGWNKDHSALVVKKAAEAALLYGQDIRDFIVNHDDDFDFMLRVKVPRNSKLMLGTQQIQNTSRCYVARFGDVLEKISPPTQGNILGQYKKKNGVSDATYRKIMSEIPADTWDERIHTGNKSKYDDRVMRICAGWELSECNDMDDFDPDNLNVEYYIQEAAKLVDKLSKP